MGRVGADLYPLQLRTPLEDVRTFERFVGGFAGNVATGLARLGVRAAIVSAVGDDGHGRFIRRFLADEGVDVGSLGTHPTLRTALAFCEAWPPDHFPVTFYREPTCPDWESRLDDLPPAIADAPLCYVSGTGLAREPSRATTLAALDLRRTARRTETAAGVGAPDEGRRRLPDESSLTDRQPQRTKRVATPDPAARHTAGESASAVSTIASWATILDLDWRAQLWPSADTYAAAIADALPRANTVIGGAAEFAAAGIAPEDALARGPNLVVVKRGPDGAVVIDRAGSREVKGLRVPVVNGLGAGDAFAAAFGAALLAGLGADEAVRRANAAGAIVASRLSCATAMPTPAEIDALLEDGLLTPAPAVAR
ncbi:MAG: PfkB family carbohydrate kinase [Candidatus Limnocylindria bacterium]